MSLARLEEAVEEVVNPLLVKPMMGSFEAALENRMAARV